MTQIPWLLPILREQDVTARIIAAVAGDRRRLVMAWAVGFLSPMRALPVRAFDMAINLLGVNDTMTAFHGRRP